MKPKITYYETGELWSKKWSINGVYHRIDGPAIIDWFPNGRIKAKLWVLNGKSHCWCGPAMLYFGKTGGILHEQWCINGVTKTKKILQWIEQNNIELDENRCIVKSEDKIFFRLRWG